MHILLKLSVFAFIVHEATSNCCGYSDDGTCGTCLNYYSADNICNTSESEC